MRARPNFRALLPVVPTPTPSLSTTTARPPTERPAPPTPRPHPIWAPTPKSQRPSSPTGVAELPDELSKSVATSTTLCSELGFHAACVHIRGRHALAELNLTAHAARGSTPKIGFVPQNAIFGNMASRAFVPFPQPRKKENCSDLRGALLSQIGMPPLSLYNSFIQS